MGIDIIPEPIRKCYQIDERRHAAAILKTDFPGEFKDIMDCLGQFQLVKSEIVVGGGGKSKIASRFDDFLNERGWKEMKLNIGRTVNDKPSGNLETHKVDFFKGKIAVEVEWNNKDPFYSRDLASFRMLHELNAISLGIIITRASELQKLFDSLGDSADGKPIGAKYGNSTTHWSKLIPRVEAGEAGNCPLLLFAITEQCYRPNL